MTTTVLEAVEQLAGIIKLQNYTTFTLYECKKVSKSVSERQVWPWPGFMLYQVVKVCHIVCKCREVIGTPRQHARAAQQSSGIAALPSPCSVQQR